MEQINALPEGSKVVLLGEARVFYFTTPHVYATVYNTHPFLGKLDDVAAVKEYVNANGITHVYVNWDEVQRLESTYTFTLDDGKHGGLLLTEARWKALAALLRGSMKAVWQTGGPYGPSLSGPAAQNLTWARTRNGKPGSGAAQVHQLYEVTR